MADIDRVQVAKSMLADLEALTDAEWEERTAAANRRNAEDRVFGPTQPLTVEAYRGIALRLCRLALADAEDAVSHEAHVAFNLEAERAFVGTPAHGS